jgi:hypothetical protein
VSDTTPNWSVAEALRGFDQVTAVIDGVNA